MNGILQYVVFYHWLLSPSIVFNGHHIAVYISISSFLYYCIGALGVSNLWFKLSQYFLHCGQPKEFI